MAQAKQGDKVKVRYTGKFDDGEVFDSSENCDPLEFTVGTKQVIPGFEEAVVGMNPGESKNTRIEADAAYGPYREEMVVQLTKDQFPADVQPEVGQQLQLRTEHGQIIDVLVTGVSDTEVTLDANHPLAGKDLTFDIELVEIA